MRLAHRSPSNLPPIRPHWGSSEHAMASVLLFLSPALGSWEIRNDQDRNCSTAAELHWSSSTWQLNCSTGLIHQIQPMWIVQDPKSAIKVGHRGNSGAARGQQCWFTQLSLCNLWFEPSVEGYRGCVTSLCTADFCRSILTSPLNAMRNPTGKRISFAEHSWWRFALQTLLCIFV